MLLNFLNPNAVEDILVLKKISQLIFSFAQIIAEYSVFIETDH